MSITSLTFVVFLATTAAIAFLLPRRHRESLLLAGSFISYGWGDPSRIILLLWVIAACVIASRTATALPRLNPFWKVLTVIPLLAYKLHLPLLESVDIASIDLDLGLNVQLVDLPLGLSFFTLQAYSYIHALRTDQGIRSWRISRTALYIAYFPQLTAGPIVHPRYFDEALASAPLRPRMEWLPSALSLLILGLFEKLAVANVLASVAADNFRATGGTPLLVFVVAFIGGFYELKGYLDIARGASLCFGIPLPPNVLQPLTASRSVADFWQRWQRTVMAFFRDHIYLPLRRSNLIGKRVIATIGTFVVVGAWHNLSVLWAAWGCAVGIVTVVDGKVRGILPRPRQSPSRFRVLFRSLVVLFITASTLPILTAGSLTDIPGLYTNLSPFGFTPSLLIAGLAGWLMAVPIDRKDRAFNLSGREELIMTLPGAFTLGVMLVASILLFDVGGSTFVYQVF